MAGKKSVKIFMPTVACIETLDLGNLPYKPGISY